MALDLTKLITPTTARMSAQYVYPDDHFGNKVTIDITVPKYLKATTNRMGPRSNRMSSTAKSPYVGLQILNHNLRASKGLSETIGDPYRKISSPVVKRKEPYLKPLGT